MRWGWPGRRGAAARRSRNAEHAVVEGRVGGFADGAAVDRDPGVGAEGRGAYAGAPLRPVTAGAAQERGGQGAGRQPSPAQCGLTVTTACRARSASGAVADRAPRRIRSRRRHSRCGGSAVRTRATATAARAAQRSRKVSRAPVRSGAGPVTGSPGGRCGVGTAGSAVMGRALLSPGRRGGRGRRVPARPARPGGRGRRRAASTRWRGWRPGPAGWRPAAAGR